jgi:hypothetical protein
MPDPNLTDRLAEFARTIDGIESVDPATRRTLVARIGELMTLAANLETPSEMAAAAPPIGGRGDTAGSNPSSPVAVKVGDWLGRLGLEVVIRSRS